MEYLAKRKVFSRFKHRFRNANADYMLIFLLPAISMLQYAYHTDSRWNLWNCLALTTAMTPIIIFRFDFSAFWILIINAFVHPFFLRGLTLDLQNVFTFAQSFIIYALLKSLPKKITKCFTFAELSILLQAQSLLFQHMYGFIVRAFFNNFEAPVRDFEIVSMTCFMALYFALISMLFIRRSLLKPFWFIIFIPAITYLSFLYVFNIEIVHWLFNYITFSTQRVFLFFSWLLILTVSCMFAFAFSKLSQSKANTCTRKVFHICLTVVFIGGLYIDPDFLYFSSLVLFIALVYLELLRAFKVQPFSIVLESICASFRDEKDSGILTLSHIYLFVGCFSSLWLSNDIHHDSIFLLTTGVVSVGIGDTFASIGGSLFGRHRWPNSKKTYEGTFCALIAQIVILTLFWHVFVAHKLTLSIFAVIVVLSALSALIETLTVRHVDNLLLPLLQYFFTLPFAS